MVSRALGKGYLQVLCLLKQGERRELRPGVLEREEKEEDGEGRREDHNTLAVKYPSNFCI